MTVPARPAATLMPLRDGPDGLEVLMVERASTLKFAAGCLVFPGGAVDPRDTHPFLKRQLEPGVRSLSDLPFRLGAIRELEEEVGIILSDDTLGWGRPIRHGMNWPRAVRRRQTNPPVGQLVPFAHWITPEKAPIRYDTHFYIMPAPDGATPMPDGQEVVRAQWIRPDDALSGWKDETVKLMFPTRLTLMKLARSTTVLEALHRASVQPPVRALPNLRKTGGRLIAELPSAEEFGARQSDPRDFEPFLRQAKP